MLGTPKRDPNLENYHIGSLLRTGRRPGAETGNRAHVHLATGLIGHAVSGMRYDTEIATQIQAQSVAERGCTFQRSTNGVILTRQDIHPVLSQGLPLWS